MPLYEIHRLSCKYVGQITSVRHFALSIALDPPIEIIHPATAKTHKLFESTCIGMIAVIEGTIMPLADEAGGITGMRKSIPESHLVQRNPIHAAHFHRRQCARAMGITPRQQSRSRRRTRRGTCVVLSQTNSIFDQCIETRSPRWTIIENPEVSVAHIIGDD